MVPPNSDLPEPRLNSFSRRRFLTGLGGSAFAAAFLAACGDGDDGTSPPSQAAATTRVITHAKGQVEVPAQAQRIVVLTNDLPNVTALGAPVVAATRLVRSIQNVPAYEPKFKNIVSLERPPDLEVVLQVQPDLIFGGSPNDDPIYDRLRQIAPTVLDPREAGDEWKERLRFIGEIVGKQPEADKLLATYQERITKLRSRLAAKNLTEARLSVIRISGTNIQLHTKGGFAGGILEEAGIKRPPSQDLDGNQTLAYTQGADSIRFNISKERLREADGDMIFIWVNTGEDLDKAKARVAEIRADPLWSQLDAVKKGKVYEVNGHWVGQGILEANLVVDDLFRGLVGEEPA